MIRFACPFVRMRRTATQDVEFHGKTIRAGEEIVLLYPAANRDPRAFQDPDVFDVRRDPEKPALSFGIGKHYCPGASLARLDTRLALEALLRRLPDIHMQSDAPPVRLRSCFVRSLTSLPVEFSAK
jgi:cytochrome P450 family 142 subfamily A polypeptide 1